MNPNDKKPKLDIPYSWTERLLLAATFIVFAGSVAHLIVEWADLPAKVPAHYNAKGEIDRWGSKWELAILPAIGLALIAGMTILSRYPHLYNYPVRITEENAAAQYALARRLIAWINLELAMIFACIGWMSVQAAKSGSDGMGLWVIPVILFVVLGTVVFYFVRALRIK